MENRESQISIRLYQPGDEEKIFSLFEIVFHKKMDPQYWKWMYLLNPAGKGIIALAFHNDTLVGHYSVIPIKVTINNVDSNAVFSLDTMTHPDYRGLGLFPKLAEFVYSEASRLGFVIVFGFPNANSYGGFIKRLGWYGSGNMNLYSIPVNNCPLIEQHNLIINKIEDFTSPHMNSLETIWNKVKKEYIFSVNHSGLYFKWRYCDRPGVKYDLYVIQSGKEIVGYFVLKKFTSNDEIKGHIIDFIISDKSYFSDILKFSLDLFNHQKIPLITFWCNEEYENLISFKQQGVKKESMERMFFGFRFLGPKLANSQLSDKLNRFNLVMGNCDVF